MVILVATEIKIKAWNYSNHTIFLTIIDENQENKITITGYGPLFVTLALFVDEYGKEINSHDIVDSHPGSNNLYMTRAFKTSKSYDEVIDYITSTQNNNHIRAISPNYLTKNFGQLWLYSIITKLNSKELCKGVK